MHALRRTPSRVSATPVPQDREANKKKVSDGLQLLARGLTMRAASRNSDAPLTSLRSAAETLGFFEQSTTWKAFVESLPEEEAEQEDELPTNDSPLGPTLERRATRYGDGVPYGNHGSWGKYREGVKEMTKQIHEGKVTPAEASSLNRRRSSSSGSCARACRRAGRRRGRS